MARKDGETSTAPAAPGAAPARAGVEWRGIVAAGGALLIMGIIPGWAPPGPWGVASFTRGVVGLIGMLLLYIGWYRWHFGVAGLIPELRMWRRPRAAMRTLAALGIATCALAQVAGHQIAWAPAPAGLLLMVVGLLMLLLAGYAWMVFEGPLSDPPATAAEEAE